MKPTKIFATALTVMILSLGMVSSAFAETPGYHGAYFSESSFLTLSPGQTGQFAVGFTNTGDQGWVKGGSAQASLHTAAPLDNTVDFTAGWASNWAAANIYAHQSTDLVAPGQIGFFVYNVTVPPAAPTGVHNFFGRPHVVASGFLEDYGYYQAVNVQTSALTITETTPASPSTTTTPTITGSGAPAGATVSVKEGSTTLCTATASSTGAWSCGSSALSGGSHSLVASAPGVGDSAAFTYVVDTSSPAVASASTTSTATVIVSFNKQMKCSTDGALASIATAGNYSFTTSAGAAVSATITATANSSCNQATLVLSPALTLGSSYIVTATNVQDSAGNVIGTTRTATFTVADSGAPTATVAVTGAQQITVTYSKAMDTATTGATTNYQLDSVTCTTLCSGITTTATTAVLNFSAAPTAGTHTFDVVGVKDAAGTFISPNPTSVSVTFTAGSSRPTATTVAASTASKVTVTFSQSMDSTTATTITNYSIQRADGNAYSSISSATCQPSTSTCTSVDLVPNTALVSGSYNVVITGLKDTFNLFINPNPTIKGPFAYTLDTSPPTVSSASATQTTLTVTYSKAMKSLLACGASGAAGSSSGAEIDRRGDYSITTAGTDGTTFNSAVAASTTAAISSDCRSVTFTWAATVPAGSYTLQVQSPQDQSNNVLSPNPTNFFNLQVVDSTRPTITGATRVSATQLRVTYSEAMKGGAGAANSAGNPNSYKIDNGSYGSLCASGGTQLITADSTQTQWTITCTGANGVWGSSGTVTVQQVQDLAGNLITPDPRPTAFS